MSTSDSDFPKETPNPRCVRDSAICRWVKVKFSNPECPQLRLGSGKLLMVPLTLVKRIQALQSGPFNKGMGEVKNIGEQHAIFIDEATAFCLETGGSIKGNCIYFAETEDRSLYTYSFEDQSITMTLPCRLSATVVPESDDSVWILIPPV
ncbi:hypothetical protein K7X08_033006 [Anisodus acutangulus]|uniref:KIB1-4 beta-propeller domain-containing protein n=1 Tax=Anisodus acutangulus TaxID=402998 RepID=A0A9Q1RBL2_9SOLA|nr:hypothetical protein K7X08_033006 [Anisodus acutangulus]